MQILAAFLILAFIILVAVAHFFTKSDTFKGASASESNNLFIQILRYWRKNAFDIDYIHKKKEMEEEQKEQGIYNALKLETIALFDRELSHPKVAQFIFEPNHDFKHSTKEYEVLEDMMDSDGSEYDIK